MMRRMVGCLALVSGCGRADVTDVTRVDLDGDRYYALPEGNDCDDLNPLVHPSAPDTTCDGVDNDCYHQDGPDDADEDGVTQCQGDCDDADAARAPDQIEVCDASDNDCDGEVDDGFDLDHDGWRVCGPWVSGGLVQRSTFRGGPRLSPPLLAVDLDQDGHSELLSVTIAAEPWLHQATVLSNTPDCFLCARAPLGIGVSTLTWFQALGDLTADGFPDVAVAEWPAEGLQRTRTLYGGATSTISPLEEAWPQDLASPTPNLAPIGDLDADGREDLAVVAGTVDLWSVHLAEHHGEGIVIDPEPVFTDLDQRLPYVNHLRSVELTGDAWPELVLSGVIWEDRPWTLILPGTSTGPTLAGAVTLPAPGSDAFTLESVVGGDFDGDGHGDLALHLVTLEQDTPAAKVLLVYGGSGGVRVGPLVPVEAFSPGQVRPLPDLDRDGGQEMAVLMHDELPGEVSTELGFPTPVYELSVEVWSLAPAPRLRQRVAAGQTTSHSSPAVEVADLNGDGVNEIVVMAPDGWDHGPAPGWMAVYDLAGDCDDQDPAVWRGCP